MGISRTEQLSVYSAVSLMLGDKLRGLRTQQIRIIKLGWKKHQGTREINLRT